MTVDLKLQFMTSLHSVSLLGWMRKGIVPAWISPVKSITIEISAEKGWESLLQSKLLVNDGHTSLTHGPASAWKLSVWRSSHPHAAASLDRKLSSQLNCLWFPPIALILPPRERGSLLQAARCCVHTSWIPSLFMKLLPLCGQAVKTHLPGQKCLGIIFPRAVLNQWVTDVWAPCPLAG